MSQKKYALTLIAAAIIPALCFIGGIIGIIAIGVKLGGG